MELLLTEPVLELLLVTFAAAGAQLSGCLMRRVLREPLWSGRKRVLFAVAAVYAPLLTLVYYFCTSSRQGSRKGEKAIRETFAQSELSQIKEAQPRTQFERLYIWITYFVQVVGAGAFVSAVIWFIIWLAKDQPVS